MPYLTWIQISNTSKCIQLCCTFCTCFLFITVQFSLSCFTGYRAILKGICLPGGMGWGGGWPWLCWSRAAQYLSMLSGLTQMVHSRGLLDRRVCHFSFECWKRFSWAPSLRPHTENFSENRNLQTQQQPPAWDSLRSERKVVFAATWWWERYSDVS